MSSLLLALALVVGGIADPVPAHRVRIDHPSGPVDADYRTTIEVTLRQVGSVAPPGAPSTLRCLWRADAHITRDARHAAGILTRAMRHDAIIGGSRAGGCAGQRAAVLAETAARGQELRDRVAQAAAADRMDLHAELDRLHGDRAAG